MKPKDVEQGLTQERLQQVLSYSPEEGVFRWKEKSAKNSRIKIGDVAGSFHKSTGYWTIWVDNYQYGAHRLAWLYVTGAWPKDMVDHRDNDKLNNAFNNLRETNNSHNKANGKTYKKKSNLPKGVYKTSKRYGAQIVFKYKLYHLGVFDTPTEAHSAYVKKAKELHGEFANDGNVIEFKKQA